MVGRGGVKGHKNCEQTFCEQTGVSYSRASTMNLGMSCCRGGSAPLGSNSGRRVIELQNQVLKSKVKFSLFFQPDCCKKGRHRSVPSRPSPPDIPLKFNPHSRAKRETMLQFCKAISLTKTLFGSSFQCGH